MECWIGLYPSLMAMLTDGWDLCFMDGWRDVYVKAINLMLLDCIPYGVCNHLELLLKM